MPVTGKSCPASDKIRERCVLHLGGSVDRGLVIEGHSTPVDAMRFQLPGGVDHGLVPG